MEHIAHTLKKDPLQVRMTNLIKDGDPLLGVPGEKFKGENPISQMIQDLKTSSDFDARKTFIENFNKVLTQFSKWQRKLVKIFSLFIIILDKQI